MHFFVCAKTEIKEFQSVNLGAYWGATPDANQSRVFWSGIWSESKEHNRNVEWLKKLKEESSYQNQECLTITKEIVFKQSRKIPKLKEEMEFSVFGLRN